MAEPASGQVPIFESVGAAYTYLLQNWMRWLPAAVIVGVVAGAIATVSPGSMTPQVEFFSATQMLQGNLILTLLMLVVSTGIYRHALSEDMASPVGFTLGMPELRVIGVTLGLSLIFLIVAFFVAFILLVMLGGAASQMGLDLENADPAAMQEVVTQMMQSGGALLFLVAMLIVAVAFVFVYVRLAFVQAATVAEGRMMAFSTWGLTKGNWWRVFACILLIVLPVGLVSGIATGVLEVAFARNLASDFHRYMFGQGLGIVMVIAQVPMVALLSYLFRGLRPSEPVDSVFE